MASVVLLPKTEPNAVEFVKAAMRDWGLDPTQEIDLSDPMSRLVLAVVITSIENGRDVYSYTQFIKGCAMSLGIDPDQLALVLNPNGIAIENQTDFSSPATGFVSPASPQIKQGGSGVSATELSGYIQLGVTTTLNSSGWSLGGVVGTPLGSILPGSTNLLNAGTNLLGGTGYNINPGQGGPVATPTAFGGQIDTVLATIRSNESGSVNGNYNIINYEARAAGFPLNVDLTGKSVAEVYSFQSQILASGSNSSALGAYQMTKGFIQTQMKELGLDPNKTTWSPELQDQLAANAAGKYLQGGLENVPTRWYGTNDAGVQAAYNQKWLSEYNRLGQSGYRPSGSSASVNNPQGQYNSSTTPSDSAVTGTNPTGNSPSGNLQKYPPSTFKEEWAVSNGYNIRTDIRNSDGTKLVGYEFTNPTTGEKVIAYPDGSIFNVDGKQLDTTQPKIPQDALDAGYGRIISTNPDGSYVLGPGEPMKVISGVPGVKNSKIETGSIVPNDPENYLVIRDGAVVKAGPSATNWDGKSNTEDVMQSQGWKDAIDPSSAYRTTDSSAVSPTGNTLGTAANGDPIRIIPGVPGEKNSASISVYDLPPITAQNGSTNTTAGATPALSTAQSQLNISQGQQEQFINTKVGEVVSLQKEVDAQRDIIASVSEERAALTDQLNRIETTGFTGPAGGNFETAVVTKSIVIDGYRDRIIEETANKTALEQQLGDGLGYFTPEQLKDYSEKIAAADKRIADFTEKRDIAQADLTQFKGTVNELQASAIRTKIDSLDAIQKEAEVKVATVESTIQAKRDEISNATDTYAGLQTSKETVSLIDQNQSIRTQIDNNNAKIEEYKATIRDNQESPSAAADAQRQIDAINQENSNLQNQYNQNQTKIYDRVSAVEESPGGADVPTRITVSSEQTALSESTKNPNAVYEVTDSYGTVTNYQNGVKISSDDFGFGRAADPASAYADTKFYGPGGVEIANPGDLPTSAASGVPQPQSVSQVISTTSVGVSGPEEGLAKSEQDPESYYKSVDIDGTEKYFQGGKEISPSTGLPLDYVPSAAERELQVRSEMPTDVPLPPPRPAELRDNLYGVETVQRDSVDTAKADSAADQESIYRVETSDGTKYYQGGNEMKPEPISQGGTSDASSGAGGAAGGAGSAAGAAGGAAQAGSAAGAMAQGC